MSRVTGLDRLGLWLISCWALVMAAVFFQPAVRIVVACLGLALTWQGMSRLTEDRVCVRIACWSYLLKIALAGALYYASFDRWPLFRSYQGERGFWVFAEDALAYHYHAINLIQAWRGFSPFPQTDISNWSFIVYVGALYRAFGSQPLVVSCLNAWWGSVIVGAGLVMMRRWACSEAAIRLGVGLLAFWPSLLLWSSQPLKDPFLLALIMLALATLVVIVDPRPRSGPTLVKLTMLLSVLLLVLAVFRSYAGTQLGIVIAVVTMGAAVRELLRARWGGAARMLLVSAIAPCIIVVAGHVDVRKLATRAGGHTPLVSLSQPVLMSPPAPLPIPPPSASASITTPSRSSTDPPQASVISLPSRDDTRLGDPANGRFQWLTARIQESLDGLRGGFLSTGGHSLMDPHVRFRRFSEVIEYLPRGLCIAILAPFPWQWFDVSGRTRIFRAVTAVEAVVVYFLVVGFLLRMVDVRRLGMQSAAVLLFVLLSAIPMGMIVANLGTLFRLRLQFLLPLVMLLCGVDIWRGYRQLYQRLVWRR